MQLAVKLFKLFNIKLVCKNIVMKKNLKNVSDGFKLIKEFEV